MKKPNNSKQHKPPKQPRLLNKAEILKKLGEGWTYENRAFSLLPFLSYELSLSRSSFTFCCGGREIGGFTPFQRLENDPHLAASILKVLATDNKRGYAFLIATTANQPYIEPALELAGFRRMGEPRRNPNSGNQVQLWMF